MAKKKVVGEIPVSDVANTLEINSWSKSLDAFDVKDSVEVKKSLNELSLERKVKELDVSLLKANSSLESAVADNERLSDELSVSVSENKSLRKELSKLKQDYKKVQGDNRANVALVESLDGELTRLKVRNKELMDTIARMQDEQKRYVEKLSNVEDAYLSCNLSKSSLDKELANYRGMSLWNRIKFVFCGDKMFVGKK